MCGFIFGAMCTLFGLGCLSFLQKIGWSSDGPGALFFYIGAFGGLFVGVTTMWSSIFSGSKPGPQRTESDEVPWP